MLKQLFTSQVRVKLLQTFIENPSEEFFIRQLTRDLGEQINSIRRELENLRKIGILSSKLKNRKKFYYLNHSCMIIDDLANIIHKTRNPLQKLTSKLKKLGSLDLLMFSGSFVGAESPLDLLLVGDIENTELQALLDKELSFKPRIQIASSDEFVAAFNADRAFISNMLKQKGVIMPINKLEILEN